MKIAQALLIIILVLPSVIALDADDLSFGEIIGVIGEQLQSILQNEYALFGIIFILLAVLFRSIFASALKRIHAFAGSGAEGLSGAGNMISWSLGFLCSISISYMGGAQNIQSGLNSILGPFSVFAGFIIGLLIFIWLKKSWNLSWRKSLFFAGLTCFLLSGFFEDGRLGFAGIIMMILPLLTNIGPMRHLGETTLRDTERREERSQEHLRREIRHQERDIGSARPVIDELERGERIDETIWSRINIHNNTQKNYLEKIKKMIGQPEQGNDIEDVILDIDEERKKVNTEKEVEKRLMEKFEDQRSFIEKDIKHLNNKEHAAKQNLTDIQNQDELKAISRELKLLKQVIEEYLTIKNYIDLMIREVKDKNDHYWKLMKKESELFKFLKGRTSSHETMITITELEDIINNKANIIHQKTEISKKRIELQENIKRSYDTTERILHKVNRFIKHKIIPEEEDYLESAQQ